MKKTIDLKCPKCSSFLIETGQSRHQTGIEHVSDPNGMPVLKPEYRCKNNCYPRYIFWDMFGDVYIGFSRWQKILLKFNYHGFKRIDAPNIERD